MATPHLDAFGLKREKGTGKVSKDHSSQKQSLLAERRKASDEGRIQGSLASVLQRGSSKQRKLNPNELGGLEEVR